MERKAVLEVRGLCKYFYAVKAIHNFDMKLYEGEIIAIVGDNGAGKSTAIKLISGVHRKSRGEIYIDGKSIELKNPKDARANGIETVYQDESLIPIFDASLNLYLGREKLQENILGKWFKFLDRKHMRNEAKGLLEKLEITLKDANAELSYLSGGQRQSVAVGRAVYWGGKILIFDEPTNNLGVKQERKVIDLIRKIRDDYNVSVIVITHNIQHVFQLVDRIIVLRNGEKIGEKIREETNPNEIVSMITGVTSN